MLRNKLSSEPKRSVSTVKQSDAHNGGQKYGVYTTVKMNGDRMYHNKRKEHLIA